MPQRILLIEDEPAIAETLVYALETDGFAPVWRATGREGLAELAAGGADLIILDVMLPDADGFALCRELRRTSRIPVLFLTARASETDRVVGLELGADDYVVKPFSPREVTARVKAILRRSSPEAKAAPPLPAGSGGGEGVPGAAEGPPSPSIPLPQGRGKRAAPPFVLDEERCRIAYRGTPLDLSRYEYRLLRALLAHPGWVYSREKLMELVWEDPAASLERTVDAHVKSLRAKLRAVDPAVEPIRTHRGLGYALREEW